MRLRRPVWPTACPECGSRSLTFTSRDPDTSQPFPWPETSFGEWARCDDCGHEWPVPHVEVEEDDDD